MAGGTLQHRAKWQGSVPGCRSERSFVRLIALVSLLWHIAAIRQLSVMLLLFSMRFPRLSCSCKAVQPPARPSLHPTPTPPHPAPIIRFGIYGSMTANAAGAACVLSTSACRDFTFFTDPGDVGTSTGTGDQVGRPLQPAQALQP